MIEKKAAAGKPADDFIRIQDLGGRVVAGSNPVTPTAEYQGVKQLA